MLGVIAVVVVAAVSAVRGGSQVPVDTATTARDEAAEAGDGSEPLEDAGLGTFPAAGALPGRLVVLDTGTCRPRVLDLATLELGPPGPLTACRAWFGPGGRYGAAALPEREGIWLLDIAAGTVGRQLSTSAEPVVFADDGTVLAQCGDEGRTIVVDACGRPRPARRRLPACLCP